MARMRNGSTTDDYRAALSGEGEIGSLGYEWSDKPHRLVYDLCGEVDHLRSIVSAALLDTQRGFEGDRMHQAPKAKVRGIVLTKS